MACYPKAILGLLLCCTSCVTASPTWEDDVVQLLHVRPAGAEVPSNVSLAAVPSPRAPRIPEQKTDATSSAAVKNETWGSLRSTLAAQMSLLQAWRAKLSAAASDALSDKKTSGLLIVLVVTLLAFAAGSCAIVSTRAYLLHDFGAHRADPALARQDLHHRLLPSLRSLEPSSTPNFKSRATKTWRQLVIDRPLEGDRLGVNLSEDTLVITSFGDPRAREFGFRIGEQIVHINGVPVFKQLDFQQVLSGAMRDYHRLKQPIVVTTVDPMASAGSMVNPPRALAEVHELCGRWQLSSGEVFVISKLAGAEHLLLTVLVGDTTAATGLLSQTGADLRCELFRPDNGEFGEAWLSYNAQSRKILASLRLATSANFGKVLTASKLPETGVSNAPHGGASAQASAASVPRRTGDGR